MPERKSDPKLGIILVLLGTTLLLAWLLNTPPGLLGKTDAVAYSVCHRISSHSFSLGDRPYSLCARCSGQYLGFLWGFILQAALARKKAGFPKRWSAALLVGLVLFYLVDGINSFIHLYPGLESWSIYQPNNTLRLFSGLGMGLGISGFYYPLLGQTVWREFSRERSLGGFPAWLSFLGGAALVGFLVLWENPLVAYYLILLSTLGLLILLTLLYAVIWVLLTRRENTFQDFKDLGWFLAAGFGTAILQIALMDALRFALTGTWSGFLEY